MNQFKCGFLKKNILKALLLLLAFPAWTQQGTGPDGTGTFKIDISGSIDWEKGEINTANSLDMASAGIRLPAGRIQGEEVLRGEYPRLLRPYILSLQADSSATVEDLLQKRELSLQELDDVIMEARKIPPSLSADLARITGRYALGLGRISAALTRHSRAGDPPRPLIPAAAADYTGIVIIADTELPIHGRGSSSLAQPCLFPKIWDTEMNLIYDKNMADPGMLRSGERTMVRYAQRESIFRADPSGIDESLLPLVGSNPLRILARRVFGVVPTDPVIDKDDAMTIISTENNRRLLREGRVAFILDGSVLKKSYTTP
ncbi:MAG: polymerase [Treponema sp.]|jgi:hypothetical protein|nr:polymerase [Treponema sp.]